MAYIQKTNPPPNKMLMYHVMDFSGGLNNRSALTAMNEGNDMLNLTYYDNIVLQKRNGSALYDAYTHSENVTHMDEYMPYTGSNQFVRAGASKLTFDNAGSPYNVTLPGNGMDGENFQGKYFFVDGNVLRVYGQFPQVGNTFIRIIGTPVSTFTTLKVISTPATYTPLDSSYVKGVTVYDYTNGNVWYEPCANEKASAYLGVSVIPSGARYIATLGGRLYVSGSDSDDDNVFISDVSNPYYFPPTLPIQCPPNSDRVMGLCVYDNSVVIGRQHDLHVITGVTNNPNLGVEMFKLTKLNAHTGFANNKAVNVAHNYLFYIGYDGECYALASARQDVKVLATSVLTKKINFQLSPFVKSLSDVQGACSFFSDGKWYVSIKDYVFVYHYNTQAWTVWNGLNATSFYYKDKLIWGNTSSQTVTFDLGYLDIGKPFLAYWKSGLMNFGDAVTYKQFRDMFLVAHTFNGYNSDIRMSFELDWTDLDGSATIKNQVAVYGTAKFGDKFTPKPINTSAPFTIGRRARTMRITFSNSYKMTGTVANQASLPINPLDEDMYYSTADDKYYVYDKPTNTWTSHVLNDFNQPMRVYQINGEYELRGKR
jgi:hypothetical protein